jgi:flagella basal body P-ring formation protein FlgA
VDGVVATRRGTALSGGALGEQVRVRIDNQRTVLGVVSGPETIRIP